MVDEADERNAIVIRFRNDYLKRLFLTFIEKAHAKTPVHSSKWDWAWTIDIMTDGPSIPRNPYISNVVVLPLDPRVTTSRVPASITPLQLGRSSIGGNKVIQGTCSELLVHLLASREREG